MKPRIFSLALVATAALVSTAFQPSITQAQSSPSVPLAASASTAVPALVPFSGSLTEIDGKPVSSETAVTFLVFKDQTGGEPLFAETQAITPDSTGHYRIQLGATLPNGLPGDLFSTGEARWLEIQAAGQAPQSRVLMASVPYALKAADSATLGGLPASAFVLAGSKAASDFASAAVTNASTTGSTVTTTGGTTGYVPEFTGASTIANSPVFVSGTNVGIGTATPTTTLDVNGTALISGVLSASGGVNVGGQLSLPAAGAATATTGQSSHTFMLSASAFNSSTAKSVTEEFEWKAEPAGNDTAAPLGTLNLLSSTGGSLAETGFHFNANGTIQFAAGQTFPGTGTGNGTITGVTAGTGLTGGGTAGNVTLKVDTTKVPLLAATTNAFTGQLNVGAGAGINGNVTIGGSTQTNGLTSTSGTFTGAVTAHDIELPPASAATYATASGSSPLDFQVSGYQYPTGILTDDFRLQAEGVTNDGSTSTSFNLLYGSNGTPAETGFSINSNGVLQATGLNTGTANVTNLGASSALVAQPAGTIATPVLTVQADENGLARSSAQQLVIQGATDPGQQLLIGYISNANTNSSGGLATIQATWSGVENTALALQPNGGCVCIRTGLTAAQGDSNAFPLAVGQGQGVAVADGWGTYSSRRFKTDIQTLNGALDKVEKLRGVSYTLKATGKREIGVIAEEVGQVVPEVVTYEANGKDARAVDYTRLTALLIEATKQQQAEIATQRAEIATQQAKAVKEEAELTKAIRQIKSAQMQIRQQAASISSLRTQVRAGEESLRQVRQQVAGRQSPGEPSTLIAAR